MGLLIRKNSNKKERKTFINKDICKTPNRESRRITDKKNKMGYWGTGETGKEMTLWNLAEIAGVKPRYMKYIREEIENLLLEKGYCVNIYKNLRNAR